MIRSSAVAVTVLTITAISVPAQAASQNRCALGGWRLQKAVLKVDSASTHLRIAGGGGATLRLTTRTATLGYNGSAKLSETGTTGGKEVKGWLQYSKTLRLKTRFAGRTLIGDPASASGSATLKLHQTKPLQYSPAPQSLAALIRSGEFSGVPFSGTFTCGGGKLQLRQQLTSKGKTLNGVWTFRRA